MTIRIAIKILTEYNKWRRGEPPYDGETPETHRDCPYSPTVIGEAIDTLIKLAKCLFDEEIMVVEKGWLEMHDAGRLDKAVKWIMLTPMYAKQPTTLVEEFKEYMKNDERMTTIENKTEEYKRGYEEGLNEAEEHLRPTLDYVIR